MVDIINLYENPWDIASSGTDTLPRGLNPNVYTTAAGYPYGITNPSLYRPLFSSRLATLSDAISCVITEEINGIYTLDMTYPVDGNGAGLIKAGRIIAAKNYPKGSRQLFKITQISKTLKNTITVRGEHLSYDLSDYTLQPITGGAQDQETGELKPIQATLDKAIEYIQGEDIYYEDVGTFNPGWIVGDIYNRTPPYTEQGDQPSVQTFPFRFQVANTYYDDNNVEHSTYDYRNAVKEIYSDKIGTVREYVGAAKTGLLSVYGGEVIFDIDDGGYANVIFTPQMGMDRGFKVVYGKNLKSMNYKIQAGKQKSAWFPYYKYTMNSDLHINLFWEIDNDLSTERARQIIGSGVNPYEGQIKPPLVYEHFADFQSYVNIFPVDVTSEVDQFLKLIGESWGHITPDSHDQPGEAEDKSIMRSWALSVGLSAYWDINGTQGYAPTSSELTFDFASLYATDGNAVEADVRLGDTVTVLYDEDGTSVKKRVIKIEYDAATGRYKKITLGDPKNKRKTAAGSIAESSLNSTAAIDTAYANAASFNRDVLSLIGEAFNTNLTVKTPLEKTYSVDSVSKNPSMGLEIKGTTNDDGKCLTWRHNVSDDTWSAVWEEVSRDHYTGQAPISISNQNVIGLIYNSNDLGVDGNHRLYIKNPVPAYEESDDGRYLSVYYDPETTDISIGWYSMSLATSSVVGGIKIGYQPAANTKNYAVQLSDGKAYVNVPWTDTKYSAGTGISINNRNEINVLRPVPAYADTEVGKVLKVFTADPDGEYLDWTTLTASDISNIETWISGKSYATTTYVNEIASGLSAAYSVRVGQNPSFNSQSDYITITGPITTTTGASIPLSSLKVGDVVYVVDTDIPDRWVSSVTSSSATLYTLETVKPAVTDVQINSSSIVSNRVANIALSSSFGFNTTNNTLSLQKAGSSTLGGIKTGYVPAVGSKDYAVMVDTNGNAHVIVPWESVSNGTNAGDVLIWSAENLAWEASTAPWYLASNPDHYISRSGISATGAIAYNNSTGVISVAIGYKVPSINSSGSDTKYFSEKGNWVSLPSDVNTWRDIGVNGSQWKTTSTSSGAIDFTNDTGISITTGTGQNANKLYIGLANTYGDSKNPYGSKTAHYVLAAPSAQNGVPTFRALDASDIPNLSYTKITGIGATTPMSYTGGIIALNYDDTKFTNDGGTLTLAESYYLASNPNNYISRSGISATGAIAYNNSTGVISVASGYTVPTSSSYQPSVWNAKYAKPSGGIPASDLAESYYLASNPNGYTSNTGTVTSVTLTSGTGITVSNSGTAITTSGSRTISLNKAGAITALGLKQLAFIEATTNDTGMYLKAIDDGDAVGYEWATPPDTKYTLTHPSNTNNLVLNQNGSALNTITLGANAWNSTSIPTTYLKSASVSGSTLTLTKQDNGTVTFTDTNTTYSFQEGSTDGGFQYKVNSGSWQNVAVHNAATIAYVNEKAAGLSASYAINTSSSVNPAFNVQTASITVTSFVTTGGTTVQASSLKVGDTVYVTNSDIPDRWVGAVTSSNATLYILETAKPAVVDVKFDSTSLLNTSTRVATLNHGKAVSFNTTDKTISVSIDTNTMAYVDSDTKIGVDTSKIPLISALGDLAWIDKGSDTTKYLRNDGTWAVPPDTKYTASTPLAISNSKVISLTYSNDLTDDGGSLTHANTITAGTASEGGSSRTLAFGGTFKIPSVTYDSHGHITNTGSITLTMPANPDTDTKVTQTATTTSAAYELLFSATADNTTRTEGARKNNNLTFNPSTGNLSSVIYTMMVGTTAKASMQYNSTTDAIDFVFVA